jgi:hypothetical protein
VGGVVLVVIFFFGLCGACPEEEEEEGKSGTVFLSWVGRNREETEEDFFQAEKEKGIEERSPKAMFSFASPLASQIGFLIASLNQSNYKSLALELNQLADYGLDGSVLLLRNCLQQIDLLEGSNELQQHTWLFKLDLLSLVVKKLLRQPNVGSVFCEAVQHIPSSVVTKAFLEKLSTELKLTLPEQIQLGLALTDAEELSHCQAGHSFCKAKISEICQTLTPAGLSEVLLEKILWFLRQTEGLSRHEQTFVKALPSLEPDALSSLLLTPLILHDQVHEVNCLRYTFSPCCFFQCKEKKGFTSCLSPSPFLDGYS